MPSATTYAEDIPGNCALLPSGRYAVKHNPQAYFVDERPGCLARDVPLGTPASGALHDAIAGGALPTVSLVVPDLCHDPHDCPLSAADSWIQGWTHSLMAGPDYRDGRLAIVVTTDEDDHASGNGVLTVVVHPRLSHVVVSTSLTLYSLFGFYEDVAGVARLRGAVTAPSFGTASGL